MNVGVGEGVTEGVADGVGVGVFVGEAVGLGVGLGVAVGVAGWQLIVTSSGPKFPGWSPETVTCVGSVQVARRVRDR